MSSNGNGTISKVVWWIMGLISAVLILGFTGWLSNVQASITTLRTESRTNASQISGLEQIAHLTSARLERIDNKLDKFAEKLFR